MPLSQPSILVTGSRSWTNEALITTWLQSVARSVLIYPFTEVTLIHGAARGADTMAAEAAVRLNAWARTRSNRGLGDPRHEPTFFIDAHPADWKTHGKAAGRIRNVEMLELGPTIVLAFLMNGSRGTMHTITEAANRDYPIIVVAPDGTTRQNFPFQSF